MPDSREPNPMPRDWASAFAALPMETPPADAWTSLARHLPHREARASTRKRNRRIYRAALAATVVLAAVIPLLHWHADNTSMPPPVQGLIAESTLPLDVAISAPLDDALVARAPASTPEPAPARVATAKDIVHATRNAAVTHSRKTMEIVPAPSETGGTQLDALHMQSAGLEAALVEMQQPKVTNPGVEVISQHLAGTIGAIDEALAEGNQDENATLALWQQRNRLLGQMLEIELRNQQLLAQRATSPFEFSQVN